MPSSYRSSRADVLALSLHRMGHDITVICPEPRIREDMHNRDYDGIRRIYTPPVQQSNLLTRARSFFAIRKAMKKILSKESFDVVRPISLIPGYVAAKLKPEIPVMTSLTDFYSDFYEQFDMPAKRIAIPIIKRIESSIMRNTDLVVIDSPSQRDEWGKWGLEHRRGVVIPHGVDPTRFRNMGKSKRIVERYGLGKSKIVFFHGDICNLDGVDLLVDAAERLKGDIKAMIVGDGTKEYMRYLKGMVKEKGIENKFIFTGWVPFAEIADYLSCADVFVTPFRLSSTSNTNITIKILEYFAMAKPIVSTKSNGISQMFPGCVTYSNPEDADSLCAAIRSVLEGQPDAMTALRKSKKIPQIYTWDNIVKHEEKVMEALLADIEQDFTKLDWNLTYSLD